MLYIITAPKDVTEVYKKADVLAWDGHLNQIFLNFGFNPDSLKRAWLKPVEVDGRYKTVNPHQLPLIRFVESIYAQQLLPGAHMNKMVESFMGALQVALRPSNLGFCNVRADTGDGTVSLQKLCQYSLLEAGIQSFFGKAVMQIDQDVIPKLLAFNENAWMLFYGLPSFLASAVLQPQKSVLTAFERFVNLPENLRSDQSWSVQQILAAQECVGIDVRSKASNSNVNNAAFWVLAHILHDEQLRISVKQEVEAAWESKHLDVKLLCAHAPVLDRTFHECLRLKAGAMMGRKVLAPTRIGNKILKTGGTVLIPSRQLHSNANVWGSDHQQFVEERFARNAGLLKHSSYRPFGGGVSLCPGRKIAREQVFALVAILIHNFDIRLDTQERQEFPRLNASTPSLGVTGPAKGMDVFVKLCTTTTTPKEVPE
ncbi:MAG: hypothetical protein LQ350_003555 [Teloschistes chrysophthalmus]|nr:MAG: hypothetical protein LQ350_003555 [Niorma chrysophthalma]